MAQHVCFHLSGTAGGAAQGAALLLASLLDPARYRAVIALSGPEAAGLAERAALYGLSGQILPLPAPPRRGDRGHQIARQLTADFIAAHRIDIVQLENAAQRRFWPPASGNAADRGVIYVIEQRRALARLSREKIGYWPHTDLILCPARAVARSVPRRLQGRTQWLYPPFAPPDPLPDRLAARTAVLIDYQLTPDTVLVGIWGGDAPRRNLEMALETARLMTAEGLTNFAFLLGIPGGYTGGDQEGAAQAQALIGQYGLEKHVFYRAADGGLAEFISSCQILAALPGGPLALWPLLTAMATGTLVLVPDDPAHRELIADGRNGVLVCPDQPDAYSDGIIAFMERPAEAAPLLAAARRDMAVHHDPAAQAQQVMALYDMLRGQNF